MIEQKDKATMLHIGPTHWPGRRKTPGLNVWADGVIRDKYARIDTLNYMEQIVLKEV